MLNRGAPKTAKNHCVLLYFRHWGVLRKSSRRDRRAPSNRDGTRGSRGVAGWGPRGPGGGPGAAGGGPGDPRAHRGGARGRKRSLGGSFGGPWGVLGALKTFLSNPTGATGGMGGVPDMVFRPDLGGGPVRYAPPLKRGAADLIASRMPPGRVIYAEDFLEGGYLGPLRVRWGSK